MIVEVVDEERRTTALSSFFGVMVAVGTVGDEIGGPPLWLWQVPGAGAFRNPICAGGGRAEAIPSLLPTRRTAPQSPLLRAIDGRTVPE
jgi:hypothetical protein